MDQSCLDEQFGEKLKCPVCLKIYTPPVYLCRLRHSMCSLCAANIKNCPSCKEKFVANSRNIEIENMLEQILVHCRFQGCTEIVSLFNMPEHNKIHQTSTLSRCLECKSNEEDLITHLLLGHDYPDIAMDEEGGLRSFSGPIRSWNKNTDWPKGIWRIGNDPLIVYAKTYLGVFHIYLYKVTRNPISISLRVETPRCATISKWKVPHVSEYEINSQKPHFNCDVNVLLNFVKIQEGGEDILKLWIRVIKKLDHNNAA
ncbi:unnamed protein product [Blepharisma stoltei]|uniref:RING-type domain-containing protein n=1 Tax=Blepharisma stoltei TaxID=1481888 RepID=A0AAU9K1G9_9CILI|nr:unnamed protein product [Blepharisma stoltei]